MIWRYKKGLKMYIFSTLRALSKTTFWGLFVILFFTQSTFSRVSFDDPIKGVARDWKSKKTYHMDFSSDVVFDIRQIRDQRIATIAKKTIRAFNNTLERIPGINRRPIKLLTYPKDRNSKKNSKFVISLNNLPDGMLGNSYRDPNLNHGDGEINGCDVKLDIEESKTILINNFTFRQILNRNEYNDNPDLQKLPVPKSNFSDLEDGAIAATLTQEILNCFEFEDNYSASNHDSPNSLLASSLLDYPDFIVGAETGAALLKSKDSTLPEIDTALLEHVYSSQDSPNPYDQKNYCSSDDKKYKETDPSCAWFDSGDPLESMLAHYHASTYVLSLKIPPQGMTNETLKYWKDRYSEGELINSNRLAGLVLGGDPSINKIDLELQLRAISFVNDLVDQGRKFLPYPKNGRIDLRKTYGEKFAKSLASLTKSIFDKYSESYISNSPAKKALVGLLDNVIAIYDEESSFGSIGETLPKESYQYALDARERLSKDLMELSRNSPPPKIRKVSKANQSTPSVKKHNDRAT